MEREPVSLINPNGRSQLLAAWRMQVAEFCSEIRTAVGCNVAVRLHPYRIGKTAYVAFDLRGDSGEVNITIIESSVNKFPNTASICRTREIECELTDMIDAYLLVALVLESTDTPFPKEFSSTLSGPKTITS